MHADWCSCLYLKIDCNEQRITLNICCTLIYYQYRICENINHIFYHTYTIYSFDCQKKCDQAID